MIIEQRKAWFTTAGLVVLLVLGMFPKLRAQTLTSSNLPIVVINTAGQPILDEPKIVASMGIIDNGPGTRNRVSDPFNNYNGAIAIETRGSSSQDIFPKKQYGIELRDASGNDFNASLLGLPPEEDWVLFAPYNDKSLMRDVLAYQIARSMGRYASRFRYCELILNGQYEGIYVLLERVKRDRNRVDVARLDIDDIAGDELSGGYILKIDKFTGNNSGGFPSEIPPPGRSADQSIYFQYEYPRTEERLFVQEQYIQDFMRTFEQTLNGPDFTNEVTGYKRFIDVGSFIDFLIVNEVSKNVDGYRLSTYFHKQRDSDGGKLVMGPVWDFNLTFGNANYCNGESTADLMLNFNSVCNNDFWLIPFWWRRFLQDYNFRFELNRRWTSLRASQLSESTLHAFIDSVANALNESQQRNFQRWPVLGTWVWPNTFVGNTYQEEVDFLKSWLSERLLNLDNEFRRLAEGAGDFCSPAIVPSPLGQSEGAIALCPSALNRQVMIEVFDNTGRRLQRLTVTPQSSEELRLPFTYGVALKPGIYTIKFDWGTRRTLFRLVKV